MIDFDEFGKYFHRILHTVQFGYSGAVYCIRIVLEGTEIYQ